jgi:hypothetical protein
MAAATGHRICNDCMKSCIFQKQEPVDIPAGRNAHAEGCARTALGLRDLQPADALESAEFRAAVAAPDTGYKVLVVGLGPAGFTLAHHLMNDGHTVVGVDGSRSSRCRRYFRRRSAWRARAFRPGRDVTEIYESLDERVMAGFGGVAEYGITVRWNKNFLKVIRLLLERRAQFAMFGGVRFGGT